MAVAKGLYDGGQALRLVRVLGTLTNRITGGQPLTTVTGLSAVRPLHQCVDLRGEDAAKLSTGNVHTDVEGHRISANLRGL